MQLKTINDYYEDVRKLWPRLPEKDIRRILNYGFRSLYLHNSYGGDTFIKDKDFLCYIGYLRNDSLKHFNYYIKKLALKIRILYKRRKIEWDGYYYFALNEKLIENYESQKKSRGRPRKWFDYGLVILYKIKDECSLKLYNCRYIFRVPYPSDLGMTIFYRNYRTDKALLIEIRNPLKFEDVLVTNHKYDVLNEKEANNTFEGGMIRDLHPLTTPSNVLTDALNATLITYNGNENILLNDMGNAKIKDALLKDGYIPVGMKEHGGIIYVAAYNPETKKGLVGSFPSPLLLWETEEWSINGNGKAFDNPNIDTSFYNNNKIIKEVTRTLLFVDHNGIAKKFHPGDRFAINLNIENALANISKGYMSILLGVIKSDGGIEIMRTWDKDHKDNFISDDIGNTFLVFNASSSGNLMLIINLHTLDTFNLIRQYSTYKGNNGNTYIKVTLTGEGTKDGEVCNSNYLSISADEDNPSLSKEITEESPTSPIIYPAVPFGLVDKMKRKVNINFNKIRKNSDAFDEWRFYVTDSYLKIGWSYDFYNLDGSKEIDYIRMYFHKMLDGYKSNRDGVKFIEFLKESFNGNFEDYVDYRSIGLALGNIYIVEVVKKFKKVKEGEEVKEAIICFKMLYLSPLYNDQYSNLYVNNAIGNTNGDSLSTPEYKCIPHANLDIELTTELDTELKESTTTVKRPGEETLLKVPTELVKSNLYIKEITKNELTTLNSDLELANKEFVTTIDNTYKGSIKIKGELKGLDKNIIGTPNPNLINSLLSEYSIESILIVRERHWENNTNLPDIYSDLDANPEDLNLNLDIPEQFNPTISDNLSVFPDIEFTDLRYILGAISDLLTSLYESTGLKPLYQSSYSAEKKNRIAPYWNQEKAKCIAGDDDDAKTLFYNSTLTKNGEVIEGVDAGGGRDDGGLSTASHLMDDPLTNIFTGINSDAAELEFGSLKRNTSVANAMDFICNDGNQGGHWLAELSDNYLITCWKFTDGDTHFVNLLTAKTPWGSHLSDTLEIKQDPQNFLKSSFIWPRLDVILRCLLSLIFVVNRVKRTMSYICPSERFYRYLEGSTKLIVTLKNTINNNTPVNDIIGEMDGDLFKSLNQIFKDKWGYDENGHPKLIKISANNLVSYYNIENLIPLIDITRPNITASIPIDIPDYYNLDRILNYYYGTSYSQLDSIDLGLDVKSIYTLDMSDGVRESNETLCRRLVDGTYEWDGTPACLPISADSPELNIFRWDTTAKASIISFSNFGNNFTTRAAEYDWVDVPENEDNEVYAKVSDEFAYGYWTNASIGDAPDMYYNVLYSNDVSALLDHKSKLIL